VLTISIFGVILKQLAAKLLEDTALQENPHTKNQASKQLNTEEPTSCNTKAQ